MHERESYDRSGVEILRAMLVLRLLGQFRDSSERQFTSYSSTSLGAIPCEEFPSGFRGAGSSPP